MIGWMFDWLEDEIQAANGWWNGHVTSRNAQKNLSFAFSTKGCVRLCTKKRNRWIQRWLVDLYACRWEMWKRWFNDLGSAELIPPNLLVSFLFFLAIHTSDEKDSPIIINESMLHVWLRQLLDFIGEIPMMIYPYDIHQTLASLIFSLSQLVGPSSRLLLRWTCGRVVSAMMWVVKALIQQWEKSQRHQARSSWWLVDGLAVFWRFVAEDFWFTVRVAWLIFFSDDLSCSFWMVVLVLDGFF